MSEVKASEFACLHMMGFHTERLMPRQIDSSELQKDALHVWERIWQIHFHTEKCQVIHK